MIAYYFALASVLTFSGAAVGFTYFSQKVSPLWMNIFKCLVSFVCCIPVLIYLRGNLLWSFADAWPLYLSGFIGLNVADWLILIAYKRMGPARTLVLCGFNPFIAGTFSYFVWGEEIYPIQLTAIVFLVACLFLFSYEGFKKSGQWEIKGLLFALSGVMLDCAGVILTRYAFLKNPELTGFDAQYLRTLAALASFVIYIPFVKVNLVSSFKNLKPIERSVAFISSFFGTFLALVFYMQAVKYGKLATVTSIALADPMMSTLFECLWLRTWPTRYLWMALACFVAAMFFLFYPQFG